MWEEVYIYAFSVRDTRTCFLMIFPPPIEGKSFFFPKKKQTNKQTNKMKNTHIHIKKIELEDREGRKVKL